MSNQYLHTIYKQKIDQYQRPRQVELDVLGIYTGANMKPEPKLKRSIFAQELESFLNKTTANVDFASIAKKTEWVNKHVSYARIFQGPDAPLPQTIGKAAMRLNTPGQTTRLIQDEIGYFIVKYIGERPPINISFEQAKEKIRDESYENWRHIHSAELIAGILKQHSVELIVSK